MTGPEHYTLAERLADSAETWLDADQGWKGNLSAAERIAYRNSDLAAAQVHATLADAAATAIATTDEMPIRDGDSWYAAAGEKPNGERS